MLPLPQESSLWLVYTRMVVQYNEYSAIKYSRFMIQSKDLIEKQSEQDSNMSNLIYYSS